MDVSITSLTEDACIIWFSPRIILNWVGIDIPTFDTFDSTLLAYIEDLVLQTNGTYSKTEWRKTLSLFLLFIGPLTPWANVGYN